MGENCCTTYNDLPTEVHHKIGSYLNIVDLKNVSLTRSNLLHSYNYPLAKRTVFNISRVNEQFVPKRLIIFNIRMRYHYKLFKTVAKLFQDVGVDVKRIKNIQIIHQRMRRSEYWEIKNTFQNINYLEFSGAPRQLDTSKTLLKTLKLSGDHDFLSSFILLLGEFERIVCELDLKNDGEPVLKLIEQNSETLQELELHSHYNSKFLSNFQQILSNPPIHLREIKLDLTELNYVEGWKPHSLSEELFKNIKSFQLTLNLRDASTYFYIFFPFVTSLILKPIKCKCGYGLYPEDRWLLPKLKDLESYDFGNNFILHIQAPALENLTLNNLEFSGDFLDSFYFYCVKFGHILRNFPTIQCITTFERKDSRYHQIIEDILRGISEIVCKLQVLKTFYEIDGVKYNKSIKVNRTIILN